MSAERVVVTLVALLWLTAWLSFAVSRIARGDRHTVSFLIVVHYLFCGIPLALDLVMGQPTYDWQRGFALSRDDNLTHWIYSVYISIVPILFWMFGRKSSVALPYSNPPFVTLLRRYAPALSVVAVLPIIGLPLIVPSWTVYLSYAATVTETASSIDSERHALLATFITLSFLAVVALLSSVQKITRGTLVFVFVVLFSDAWLSGKRSMVALIVMLSLYVLWQRGTLRRGRFLGAGVGAAAAVLFFSIGYQTEIRGFEFGDDQASPATSSLYTNYRIDFGRDAVMRQTIWAELNPESMQILEYAGQSLVFDALFLVPRKYWPEKPWPYSVYVTSAMLRIPLREIGWGVTTTWLEEAIANFGWFGILLGPILPALMCRFGDATRDPVVGAVTVLVSSLFLTVHLPAFFVLFVLWLVMTVVARRHLRADTAPAR